MRTISYGREAAHALRRIPANVAALIEGKLRQYAADPDSLRNNVKRLQGTGSYRLRVGDWRVIFRDDGIVIVVSRIAPRGGAYD